MRLLPRPEVKRNVDVGALVLLWFPRLAEHNFLFVFIHAVSYWAPHRTGLDSACRERIDKHCLFLEHTHAHGCADWRTHTHARAQNAEGHTTTLQRARYTQVCKWCIKKGEMNQTIQLQTDQGMEKAGRRVSVCLCMCKKELGRESTKDITNNRGKYSLLATVMTKGKGCRVIAVIKWHERHLCCCVWRKDGCEVLFSMLFFFILKAR